jgi:hypothetical protein
LRVYADNGAELDATFSVERSDAGTSLVFESASGRRGSPRARNRDYDQALKLILARLGAAGFRVSDGLIDSSEVLANFPAAADRRLDTSMGFPIDPGDQDPHEQLREHTRIHAKGGVRVKARENRCAQWHLARSPARDRG